MHFYEALTDGGVLPRHFVPLVSRPDDLRPTRISDVRKMWAEGRTVVPSVTTVLDVLGKPGLVNWKIDQHLLVAFEAALNINDADAWIAEVKRLTEIEMDKAPSAGSDLHKSLEDYVREMMPQSHPDYELCNRVFGEIVGLVGCADWHPERKFVSPLGYGGQVDLSNDSWIIDFKTKQDASKWKPGKMAFPEHAMQLAAYRRGLWAHTDKSLEGRRAANVFICPENGEIDFHEHSEEELQRGWDMFSHCLAIWNLQHR